MMMENILDQLHTSVTRRWWTQLFTAFLRVLLAIGFIPPSIPKILHQPFTILPDTNPVGAYFNALYNTGYYYDFIGWSQLFAALLLIIPRTSHLGALMFFPIIVNIAVLTNSVGFQGTWLITILMTLAATWLVAWEYDRLKPIIFRNRQQGVSLFKLYWLAIPLFFAAGGFVLSGLFRLLMLGNMQDYFKAGLVLAAIGFVFGIIVAAHYRLMRVGHLEKAAETQ
ncbi:MAG: DoxX family protein [Acidobacteria bacterium]|nr:DoxX family protein [Acidobacteriota bacterium]